LRSQEKLPITIVVRRFVLLVLVVGAVVSGCGASKPKPRMVSVPNVVGLAADRGIQRVRAAGLCPEPRLADTIGSPPYASIAFVTPVAGVRVPAGTVVLVDIAPGSQDANIFSFQGC